jgi:homoserine kinase type II
MLARLHLAGADFPAPLPNPCGHDWRERTGRRLAPALAADERGRLLAELDFQAAQDHSPLPRGIVHGDLFRDNVLWQDDGEVAGVLDFYYAEPTACCSIWRWPPTTGAPGPTRSPPCLPDTARCAR